MNKFASYISDKGLEVTLLIDKGLVEAYTDHYLIKRNEKHYQCVHREKVGSPSGFRILTGNGFAESNICANRFTIRKKDLIEDDELPNTMKCNILIPLKMDGKLYTDEEITKYLSNVKEVLTVMSDKYEVVKEGSKTGKRII